MEVGDLVKYAMPDHGWDGTEAWHDYRGLVIRCIAGTDKVKVVLWMDGVQQSIPERELVIVNHGIAGGGVPEAGPQELGVGQ